MSENAKPDIMRTNIGSIELPSAPFLRGPTLQGEYGRYTIMRAIYQTDTMCYYLCQGDNANQNAEDGDKGVEWRLLCIAARTSDNPAVKYTAEVLEKLACASDQLEQEYAKLNHNRAGNLFFEQQTIREIRRVIDAANKIRSERGEIEYVAMDYDASPTRRELEEVDRQRQQILNRRLSYDQLFPRVLESFMCNPQGHRQVNILEFTSVDLPHVMLLEQILQKQRRVSLKTSAWIVQRMLKLFAFTREAGYAVPFGLERFLIGPDNQQLMLMNWENTRRTITGDYQDGSLNLARIGEFGLKLVNATFTDDYYNYPYEHTELEQKYLQFLHQMATLQQELYFFSDYSYIYENFWKRRLGDACYPYSVFTDLIEEIWGRMEAEFVTLPLEPQLKHR